MILVSGIKNVGRKGIGGAVNRLLASNVEKVLAIPGGKLYRNYIKAAKNVKQTQTELLLEIVSHSENTVFGRQHGFSLIRSYEDFKKRLPIRDYEAHRPYVNRHANGERDVLFPGKPIMYTRTSGTTAEPKLIPISEFNFERTIKNRGKLWLYGLSKNFPGIYKGKDFTIVSPAEEGRTPDNTIMGSISGFIYQNIPEFVKLVHTIPYDVITIRDWEAKAYTLLRFGLPSNVTSIFTGNPATILNLAQKADLWKEDLIRDVYDGTLKSSLNLEHEIRQKAQALLEPCPKRARELEDLATKNASLHPIHYWPNLRLVHTWTNGNCSLVIPKLRPWLGEEVPILDFGYVASEITASDLMDPETNGSYLAVKSAFFEFSPVVQGEKPETFLMADELEVGEKYYIYVTTLSGLYRYDMNDVIEVVGRFHDVPILKFLYKGKGVTSIQGEKLSEAQLIAAMTKTAEMTGIGHEFFVAFANAQRDVYELYVELIGDQATENSRQFAKAVDEELRKINIEYDAKRRSERLKPLELIPLGKDAFARYRELRMSEGALEGQFKWLHLSDTEVTQKRMKRLSDQPSSPFPNSDDGNIT